MAEHSPLDAVHRELGARMVPFGGWEMPLEYPTGTLAEHLACRADAVVFDVSHLGTVQVAGGGARDTLQDVLSNDLGKIGPGRAQYTHLLDEADGSVLDDIIVWWHPGSDGDVFDVMPNASNTDRVRAAIGGRETTHERAVLAVQGPAALERLGAVFPEAAAVGRFRVAHCDVVRRAVRRRRHRLHGGAGRRDRRAGQSPPPTCGPRSPPPASSRPGSAPATRCAWRPASRCTATSSAPASRRSRPAWAGSWRGASRRSGARRRWRPSGLRVWPATSSASPRRAAARRAPSARCSSTAASAGEVTSGNFSPVLGHGIALAFVPPSVEEGATVAIDVRGTALPGTVVATPFVSR